MKLLQNLKKPDISLKDILIISGVIMVGKGLFMIYPPAMWIGIGAFMVWMGIPGK